MKIRVVIATVSEGISIPIEIIISIVLKCIPAGSFLMGARGY